MSTLEAKKMDELSGLGQIQLSNNPAVVTLGDLIYIFYQDPGAHGNLYYSVYDPTNNTLPTVQKLIKTGVMSESPGAAVLEGTIYLTFQEYGANQVIQGYTFDPSTNSLKIVQSRYASVYQPTSPSLAIFDGHILNFSQQKEHEGSLGNLRSFLKGDDDHFDIMVIWEKQCMSHSPSAIEEAGSLTVFVQDYGATGYIRQIQFTDTQTPSGKPWFEVISSELVGLSNSHAKLTDSPNAIVNDGFVFVFYQKADQSGDLYYAYREVGAKQWTAIDCLMANNCMTGSPTTTVHDGTIYIFTRSYGNGSGLEISSTRFG